MTTSPPGTAAADTAARPSWIWPPDRGHYDTSPDLSVAETAALAVLRSDLRRWRRGVGTHWGDLRRLVRPLGDARATMHAESERSRRGADNAVAYILLNCAAEGSAFWAWDSVAWTRVCAPSARCFQEESPLWTVDSRPFVIGLSYLVGAFTEPLQIGEFERVSLARKLFGSDAVDDAVTRITTEARALGYRSADSWVLPCVLCEALLLARSPQLSDLTENVLGRLRLEGTPNRRRQSTIFRLHRVLASLGLVASLPWRQGPALAPGTGVAFEWLAWVERWHQTSPLTPTSRRSVRTSLLRTGRWLAAEHPEITTPADWSRQLCASFIAHVQTSNVGDYAENKRNLPAGRIGQPLLPRSKADRIYAVRQFFRDCHEWEWLPRRFDAARALAAPRSLRALIGPDPRVIDDVLWAKLLWAGINLTLDDFPRGRRGTFYPIELLRALTLTWLFAGLRSDEISRLRVGCVRWQSPNRIEQGPRDDDAEICLLDVPTNKTGTAFTKPVEPLVGKAIAAWEAVRPQQPQLHDRKTGVPFHPLFCCRGYRVSPAYINDAVIPTLCHKAGVPLEDARGRITSHRARATIASQLYNAKDPMTLFELQSWLGHRSPQSTQHYAQITPTTLSKAYSDAGYFARNVRTIDVLLDREAVKTGASASGAPWQYFDLGHGFCTYDFFEQCPHRMACAKCDFYLPKDSSKAHLLEARINLQRMRVEIPLTDDELAAVDDGEAAVERLIAQLADVPTPSGPTPRSLRFPNLTMVIALNVSPSSDHSAD